MFIQAKSTRFFIAVMVLLLTACAEIRTYKTLEQPKGKELYATIGGVVLKVRKTRDLPNVFGKADIWGGKVDEGFIELRYQNLNEDGTITFWITDLTVLTDEDVFSRYLGGNKKKINLQTRSNSFGSTTTGTVTENPGKEATREVLPPNTREFKFDYKKDQDLIVADTAIKIIGVTPVNLKYVLTDIPK